MIVDGQFYPEYGSAEDIALMKTQTPEQLENTPHDKLKWQCCVKGCTRFSRVKDFGIAPWFWWGRRGWIDLRQNVLYCARHWKVKDNMPESRLKLGSGIIHLVPDQKQ